MHGPNANADLFEGIPEKAGNINGFPTPPL